MPLKQKNNYATQGIRLIAGLGNPGARYLDTRHNIGFRVVEELAKSHDTVFKKRLFSNAKECRIRIAGKNLVVIQPLSFMNLSGQVIGKYSRRLKVMNSNILIVHDDIDLLLGQIKIKPGGSSAGHNGLKSIMQNLKTEQVARLRLGIKTKDRVDDLADYVLSDFTQDELASKSQAIQQAVAACECWASYGIDKAMSIYN
jgi:peptidyl-tRNA hydrolase, PTH1 family